MSKKHVAEVEKSSFTHARASMSTINVWCRFDEAKDITTLIPNPRNPNTHGDKQIALLSKIIRNQGWRQPITVSNRSGFIVKGHGRLAAAKMLQVEQVPVEFQDYATEADEYADLIADNRIAELAEPDQAMLAELTGELMAGGFDMDLTGFDEEALGSFDFDEVAPPELKDGDREPFRQATFTLHDEQWEEVEAAIAKAKQAGGGESAVNENSNGNALAWVCRAFNGGRNG